MQWTRKMRSGFLQRLLSGLDWVARRRSRLDRRAPHLLTGMEGERAAYFYLEDKGYIVVETGWSSRNHPGDLDLIAWLGSLLCFVEVKSRTSHDASPAEIRVDAHKRTILRRLVREYLRQLPGESFPEVRFDVISVYLVPGRKKEIYHFENAFGWKEGRWEE